MQLLLKGINNETVGLEIRRSRSVKGSAHAVSRCRIEANDLVAVLAGAANRY
jgi:hypothetical protein